MTTRQAEAQRKREEKADRTATWFVKNVKNKPDLLDEPANNFTTSQSTNPEADKSTRKAFSQAMNHLASIASAFILPKDGNPANEVTYRQLLQIPPESFAKFQEKYTYNEKRKYAPITEFELMLLVALGEKLMELNLIDKMDGIL